MLRLRWLARLLRDIFWMGMVNKTMGLSFVILGLLLIGMVVLGVQVSAPFIYTLF
jgi:hypothetical protein